MKKIELKEPKSLSFVYSVFPLLAKQPLIAYAAAVGMCWKGKPLDGNMYGPSDEYGHTVLNQLLSAGHSLEDITQCGLKAITEMQKLLPTSEEVQEEEGNSEAKE